MVRLIKEFANSRNDEIYKLKNIREILREHLMCIYFWRDTDCKNHWEGEIFAFLPIMDKLKGAHKLLPEKVIYENLFTDWAESYHNNINVYIDKLMIKEKGMPKIKNKDVHNLYNFLEDFYRKVCHILATKGNVDKNTLYNIIEILLRKYTYSI